MRLRMRIFLLAGVALLASGCFEQMAGNSTETENTATARWIRVDSVLPDWNRPNWISTVATLRLDSSNFDFSHTDSLGRDLSVQLTDSIPLPFEVVFWNKSAARGRIHVRIDPIMQFPGCQFLLKWNQPLKPRSDSTATWRGILDSQRLAINSVRVDDFEGGSLVNRLPVAAPWKTFTTDSNAVVSSFGIATTSGRAGKVLHMGYDAGVSTPRWVLATTAIASTPRCFRSLDSIVLYAKGAGTLNAFSVALEHINQSKSEKAWKRVKLDTVWQKIKLRPQDFDAPDTTTGNVGWNRVKDMVTNFSILDGGKGDVWIDDVRFYGIGPDDLR